MNRVNVKAFHSFELPKTTLSKKESQVAHLVTEGLTRIEIGKKLFISPHTVDMHCKRISAKTGYRISQYWKLRDDIVVVQKS